MPKKTNPLLEQEQRRAQQEMLVKQAQEIKKQVKKTKLTLLLPEEDIAAVKKIAIDKKTSVSAMVHEWIVATTDS